jgi:hypothetical protein
MLFKSTDSGATWKEVFTSTTFNFSVALSPSYATDNTIYLYVTNSTSTTYSNRLYKSIDAGETWNINSTYSNTNITTFSAIDGTNYWFGNANGVRSTLSTSSFVNLNGQNPGVPYPINYGTFILVKTGDGDFWYSTDSGVSFTSLGVPAADGNLSSANLVSVTDAATKTLYILDSGRNILSWTIGTSTAWTNYLSSSILEGTGGIQGLTVGQGSTGVKINQITKGTGAWYFLSQNNTSGQIWRSTTLKAGSFEAVPNTAYNTTNFGTVAYPITVSNDKTTGNNTIIATVGYDGTTASPATYNYKVVTYSDSVLAAPVTTAPVANANTTATVDFSWKAVTNATSYDVQIAYDSAFDNIFKQQVYTPTASNATQYPSSVWAQVALNAGQTYYWRVRVSLASPMASAWSTGVMFTTQLGSVSSSGIDVGRYPSPGASGVTTNSFSWGTVSGATTYDFKISTKADFSDIVDSSVGLTQTVYQTLAALKAGTTYFWEVRAVAGTVTGPWVTATFTTATAAQANPTTAAPVATSVAPATIVVTQPAAVVTVIVPTQTGTGSNSTPAWAWVVIAIAAVLVIAVIVLIARTRRV